jgi:hypothetical protein
VDCITALMAHSMHCIDLHSISLYLNCIHVCVQASSMLKWLWLSMPRIDENFSRSRSEADPMQSHRAIRYEKAMGAIEEV